MDSSLEMKILFKGKKRIDAEFNGFTVQTDQPVEAGGERLAPGPFDLFLASIGTCAAVFIQSFCEKRKIPTERIELTEKVHWDEDRKLVTKVTLELLLPKYFPEKYRESVISAVNLCTVKRHLKEPPQVEIVTQVSQE
jgi:ribosomal protein S12 methylthiotransferase accessory factor